MDSLGHALGVVVFIRVNSVAPWWSSGSFGFVALIQARPWGRRVHSGWSLGVVVFIRVRWVNAGGLSLRLFGCAVGVVGFLLAPIGCGRVCCVHSGAPRGIAGSFGFIREHNGHSRVHSCSLRSFNRALLVVRFIHSGARRPHFNSGARRGSFVFFVFIRVHPRGRRVHLGSFGYALLVVEFIPVRWVHSCASFESLGSSGSLGSFMSGQEVVGFICVH